MTDYAIRPTYNEEVSNGDSVIDGVNNLANQISQESNKTVDVLPAVEVPSSAFNNTSDEALFDGVIEWLEDDGYVADGDMVAVGHGSVYLGFGHTQQTTVNGKTVYGGNVYADYLVSSRIVEMLTIHELGHGTPFYLSHSDGHVETNASDEVDTVTPMATSYVKDASGICDTEACGSTPWGCGGDAPPSNFCYSSYSNETASGFADCPIHTTDVSECYKGAIRNHSGNLSSR